jgi:hypothetical protein
MLFVSNSYKNIHEQKTEFESFKELIYIFCGKFK